MARPVWKGFISFGLVNIPVTLFPAEKSNELQFHLLDKRDKARIHYVRLNEKTGKEVPWDEVIKAFEFRKNHFVPLDEEDFKRAAVESTQTVEIEGFVDIKQIDPIYFDKPYYLLPDKKGEKGYALLQEILSRSEKAGIAKVVIRTRQHLAALMAVDNFLVLNSLRFKSELRDIKDLSVPKESLSAHKISPKEIEIAEQLVKAMTTKWNPEIYHDDYQEALMQLIAKKEKGIPIKELPATKRESAKVIDFMSLLKKSIEEKSTTNSQHRKHTTRKSSRKR